MALAALVGKLGSRGCDLSVQLDLGTLDTLLQIALGRAERFLGLAEMLTKRGRHGTHGLVGRAAGSILGGVGLAVANVAYGIYFYVVESPVGSTTGKIAIIK